MKLKLISFDICPYVQRSVITLKYKNIPFDIEYIDLKNKPDWFLEISPLGKVPVMVVDDKTTLFESAVINEFADEISGGDLLPSDPVEKAKARAWIEYSGGLLTHFYQAVLAQDQESFDEKIEALIDGLMKMKKAAKAPYFLGESLSLVDSSIAPLFVRMKKFGLDDAFIKQAQEQAPNLLEWYNTLTDEGKDYITTSAPSDLYEKTCAYLADKDSYFVNQTEKAA
ncbi:MAG: glutathione S-transferase family protein [Alphaproteobacteria bacterium]